MHLHHLFETYLVPPAMARAEILRIWKALPDETVDHGNGVRSRKMPNLPEWLAEQSDEALEGILEAYEEMERDWKLRQSAHAYTAKDDAISEAKRATLASMLPAMTEGLRSYLEELYEDEPEEVDATFADEDRALEYLDMFLTRERSVEVRDDGLISFWVMEPDLWEAIGDMPVALFHYTSSAKLPSIKRHGLQGNRRSVNGRKADGVYLTTERSGPAVNGYKMRACQGNKGYPVCITVKCHLYELGDDEDDADIQSGAHQYVVDHVPPDRFVEIERA